MLRAGQVRVKNMTQKSYVEAINKSDVVFGIGPAGTGKTFLAVVCAVAAFKRGEVSKIILTRPGQLKPGNPWAFCQGTLRKRLTLTCGQSMTPFMPS